MNRKLLTVLVNIVLVLCLSYFISCTKAAQQNSGYNTPPINVNDTCHHLTVTASITSASACASNGSIRIIVSGANGLSFKLGSTGVYQTVDSFVNIPAGTYTVYVKDSAGCESSAIVTVTSSSVSLNATSTTSGACTSDGSITVSATGSTGFQYKVGSAGTYQYSGMFNGIGVGTYTVYAKDTSGCETTTSISVNAGPAGPLFTSVDSMMAIRCQSCHNNNNASDGMNWQNQCNIVLYQSLINYEVQNNLMPYGGPALTTQDKAIITDWINAGGTTSN